MNIFVKSVRQRKIAVSLLISYILVLIVPYVVNRISYMNIESTLMDEIKNYNAEYLSGRVKTLDATIANVSEMVDTIYLNRDFQKSATLTPPLTVEQLYNLASDKSYIYGGFGFYVENVMVFYKNLDYYVGQNGGGNLSEFYSAYYRDRFESYDEWYDFMMSEYYGELVIHSDYDTPGNGSVFYALSYKNNYTEELLANIIVEFKRSFLLSDSNDKSTFFIADGDNKVAVCDEDESFINTANIAMSKDSGDGILNVKFGKQNKILVIEEIPKTDWTYVSCISEDVFLEKVDRIQINYMYALIVSVLFGGIIILWALRKHYRPIDNIAKLLSKKFKNDMELNEYQYITSAVTRILNDYRADSRYQIIEKKLAMNTFLHSVLKGDELVTPEAVDKLEYFGFKFKNSLFCTLAISIKDCSNLFYEEGTQGDNLSLAKLITENIYSDILKEKYEFAFCENGNNVYALISLSAEEEYSCLKVDIINACQTVEEVANIKSSVGLSDVCDDFRNITVCYIESLEVLQNCYVHNNNFLTWNDIDREKSCDEYGYVYHAGVEQKLINCLMYGNYDESVTLLQQVVSNSLNVVNGNLLLSKCLFFDIAATVFKTILDKDDDFTDFNRGNILATIDSGNSVADIQEEFCKLFKSICDVAKSNYIGGEDRLSDGIVDFVQMNYSDHNLNVAYISAQFNVTANYVSTVFKKEKGIALSEFISNVRIEHAKELLKNTNTKAADIADRVGFSSFRTFSRVFSSMLGVSPSEYRKMN